MKVEIVTTGSELLLGEIVNTNAAYMAQELNKLGFDTVYQTTIGDNRERIPGVCIRTTFIVGFPGETDEQFQELYAFAEQQHFDKIGVFTYSQEEGTPAADMPGQISEDVMQERYHRLMSLAAQISEEANQKMEGKEIEVLIEGKEDNRMLYGRSYREAPDVDGVVSLGNDGDIDVGTFVKARITQGVAYDVLGERME